MPVQARHQHVQPRAERVRARSERVQARPHYAPARSRIWIGARKPWRSRCIHSILRCEIVLDPAEVERYCIHCLKDLPATNHDVAHLGSRFGTGCAMSCIWTRDEGDAAACVGGSQPVRQSLNGARGTSRAAVWTPRVRPERLQSRSQLGLAIPTVPTTRMSHFPIRSPSSSAVCLDDGDRWLLPYQQQGQSSSHGRSSACKPSRFTPL